MAIVNSPYDAALPYDNVAELTFEFESAPTPAGKIDCLRFRNCVGTISRQAALPYGAAEIGPAVKIGKSSKAVRGAAVTAPRFLGRKQV